MSTKKANLFLIGAMKAGTTGLMDLLGRQEAIYASPIKEPHYFATSLPKHLYDPSRFFSEAKYFEEQFPKPHHIANVQDRSQYEQLFSLAGKERYLLEGSTMYLHAPGVAERIFEYNSDAKIIVVTREPLSRAFSQYRMLVGLSQELRSFQSVMEAEIERYHNGSLPWHSCLNMSFYERPINTFKKYFKDVCVISFEDFIADKEQVAQELSTFLEIPLDFSVEGVAENSTRTPKAKGLLFVLKRIGLKDFFSFLFPSTFKHWLYRRLSSGKRPEMGLSDATKAKLNQIFEKEATV
ncbi:sulfotransferase family protein [Altibacter sp. HG106]|uniref:sulfotransferase family protein n=1 Tax=Altibacter sp. HG106 TaxID=3023937 RepID=UPI0023500D23|nr:sulfotransferase [Altibacter sp. HG106]MDC7995360.1 sulfotransferase [Altibacter sp. HG106]